eukprot:10201418-Alexandrium_andersonii.AAC.1
MRERCWLTVAGKSSADVETKSVGIRLPAWSGLEAFAFVWCNCVLPKSPIGVGPQNSCLVPECACTQLELQFQVQIAVFLKQANAAKRAKGPKHIMQPNDAPRKAANLLTAASRGRVGHLRC